MMSRKKKVHHQPQKSIEESRDFSDDYLVMLLNKAEIVLRNIRSTSLQYGKE